MIEGDLTRALAEEATLLDHEMVPTDLCHLLAAREEGGDEVPLLSLCLADRELHGGSTASFGGGGLGLGEFGEEGRHYSCVLWCVWMET